MKSIHIPPVFNNRFTGFCKAIEDAFAMRKRKILNLSDTVDEFNCFYGEGYGQRSGRTVSINLIAPHKSAKPGMLTMQDGHLKLWTVMFDGVVVSRFIRKGNAIAAMKRTLTAE